MEPVQATSTVLGTLQEIVLRTDMDNTTLELFSLTTKFPSIKRVTIKGSPKIEGAATDELLPTLPPAGSNVNHLILEVDQLVLSELSDILQGIQALEKFRFVCLFDHVYEAPQITQQVFYYAGDTLKDLCLRTRFVPNSWADTCVKDFSIFTKLERLELSFELLLECQKSGVVPGLPVSLEKFVLRDVELENLQAAAIPPATCCIQTCSTPEA